MANDGFTDYMSDLILNLFRGVTITQFGSTHIGIFETASPTDAYTGASPDGTEVSGGAYARKVVTTGQWAAPSAAGAGGQETSNDVAVTWSAWDSGSVTLLSFGVFDLITVGEMFGWAVLTTARAIANGETATFDLNTLIMQCD
jgi:hypothetical protein